MKVFIITLLFGIFLAHSIEGLSQPPQPRRQHFIVNGTDANIEDIPFQVSVRWLGSHSCGGSILTETIILSAAHCFYPLSAQQIITWQTVRVGATHRDQGREISLANALVHADFTDETYQYDVALLKLAETLEYGPTIQPVQLVAAGTPLVYGNFGVVSGWGRLYHGGPLAIILQAADVEIKETARCAANYASRGYTITYDMFCAGSFIGEVDNCHGDSGGPLIEGGHQIGIVSWGLDCAQHDFPGVYASVAQLRGWIDDNLDTL